LPPVPRSPSQRILQASLYDRNPIRRVITDEIKNSIIPIKFRDAKDIENNLKCSIMCETFQEDDDIIQLPCNHCFFAEPIMKWLTEDSCECPVCRYKFDSMEKNMGEEPQEEPIEEIYNNDYNAIEQINISNIISTNENINNIEFCPITFNYFEDPHYVNFN
jgi:hypothetical protein